MATMEEYDPADPTEDAGGGQTKGPPSDEKPQETNTNQGQDRNETQEKTEIKMDDFPTQFGRVKKKPEKSRFFHEGMADLPSRYEDEDEEEDRRARRWRDRGDGDIEEEKRFEEDYDSEMDRRFGRGRGRGGRFGRPPRSFDDDDEFGRDGPPRFDDNPFRRLEKGDGRPPPDPIDRPRFDDRPPYDDEPRYDSRRFRRREMSPPPFDDDRRRRYRRDGPPFDGPPFDRPPYDDYDRPPRYGPPRFDHDGPPRFDRDGPPPPHFSDERPFDRFHYYRDRDGPPFGPPRPDSPGYGPPHHGPPPPPPRPRGGLLPTPPPVPPQPEPQYPGPPPDHGGMPFPDGPRFGPPPPPTGPPPPMGPPPFQGPMPPYQGPPFPAPAQPMMPQGMPGPPPEMPPMSVGMDNQQYYAPPPPPMMPQGDPNMYQQMAPGTMPPGAPPPPPPPHFQMQPQQPPPPPPMEHQMPPQMMPPPMDQQMMVPPPQPQMPPQPPMSQPQPTYEPPMMPFLPPPPPPEPAGGPTLEAVPEQIPVPPPPMEDKSEDMDIEMGEPPDVPIAAEQSEEASKLVYSSGPTISSTPNLSVAPSFSAAATYSAAPTFSAQSISSNSEASQITSASTFSSAPVSYSAVPPVSYSAAPIFSSKKFSQPISEEKPPPPTVVFPTHIYSAPLQIQEEVKTPAQKAAEELMKMSQPNVEQVAQAELVIEEPARGFVPVQPVEPEPAQEIVQKEEQEPEIKSSEEREATPEKQMSGDPIKTTAQQLLERIKQKQLKAQASTVQAGGANPLVKSTRRFFNPVAMVAGSKIQFAMAAAKKNVTSENPLKAVEDEADKKKKGKEGKKEMFRPGLDGEETLTSIMQKYQQHQKLMEHLKTSKENDGETETTDVNGSDVKTSTEETAEEKVNDEPSETDDRLDIKKKSRFADMTEEELMYVKEKEVESGDASADVEKPTDITPERKQEDEKSFKRPSPTPEPDDSKSRRRRQSPSPRESRRSKTPERSRERRDSRRSRSRSYEDRYSNRKSRRSPSPRRRDYDDRQRRNRQSPSPRYDYRRDEYRRNDRAGSPYGRGYKGWRQDVSPGQRIDYRSKQRDRSPSPRSKNYRNQQRSPSPRTNYRRPKERSPSPVHMEQKAQREYSQSPDRDYRSDRERSPEGPDLRKKPRDASPRGMDYRSSKHREISPQLRQGDYKQTRTRDRSPPDYRKRTPSPKFTNTRGSKMVEQSPRQADYRSSKPRERSAERPLKARDRSPSPEIIERAKPRERSVSPRSSSYRPKRMERSVSPKPVENKLKRRGTSPSAKGRIPSPDARRGSRQPPEEKRPRKESPSSSSSSSESSSSEESDSDDSSETPEDERIKKEKREKLLMELKNIEESLEKQRTLKKKGKGKEKSDDRERSEDRQSYTSKSSRSEELKMKREEGSSSQQVYQKSQERTYEERSKQEIPDLYLKTVEKYQKEFKSRKSEYEEPSRRVRRDDYEQTYGPEEKRPKERRDQRMDYEEQQYQVIEERHGPPARRGDDRAKPVIDDRRYGAETQTYGDDVKREKADPRISTKYDKRKQVSRIDEDESSDEEIMEKARMKQTTERKRDSRSKYSDRSPVEDPRMEYGSLKSDPTIEEKYKPERSDMKRGFESRSRDGNYSGKKRESYAEDEPDRSRTDPRGEYNIRRPDPESQYDERSKVRMEYEEVEKKKDWDEPAVEYEEKKQEYRSKPSEYESYEGYYQGSRSTSEKSYKIDPVDELDYYLNRKPKAAQGQPEKNGKWHTTEKSASPPDIRQSYYSPDKVDSEEDDAREKKSKKKKKHQSRSPVSRETKKKSKRSKRSSSEESEDQDRYRRSYRSPLVEEFERENRRRSPSPRYRRTPSPEDQPYNSRAERYWRPPDHKLDEIHHYTDKKHKCASMVKDFPELLEIEKGVKKSPDADRNNKDDKDKTFDKHPDDIVEKVFTPDPSKKQEPDNPPIENNQTETQKTNASSIGIQIDSAVKTESKKDYEKGDENNKGDKTNNMERQTKKRPKIKRLPVPDTSPRSSQSDSQSYKSNQSDTQSEASCVSDNEKATEGKIQQYVLKEDRKTEIDENLGNPKIKMDNKQASDKGTEISRSDTVAKEKSTLEIPDKREVQPLVTNAKKDSPGDTIGLSVERCEDDNLETSNPLSPGRNMDFELAKSSSFEIKAREIVNDKPIPADIENEARRSIIADYSDSDDNTNQDSTEINTSQNLADKVFLNIMSKMAAETANDKSVEIGKVEVDESISPSPAKEIISSEINLENAPTNSKSDQSNDAIKLQYKRTRYGVRLRSKDENNEVTGIAEIKSMGNDDKNDSTIGDSVQEQSLKHQTVELNRNQEETIHSRIHNISESKTKIEADHKVSSIVQYKDQDLVSAEQETRDGENTDLSPERATRCKKAGKRKKKSKKNKYSPDSQSISPERRFKHSKERSHSHERSANLEEEHKRRHSQERNMSSERRKRHSKERSYSPEIRWKPCERSHSQESRRLSHERSLTPEYRRKRSNDRSNTPVRRKKHSQERSPSPVRTRKHSHERRVTPMRRTHSQERSPTYESRRKHSHERSLTPELQRHERGQILQHRTKQPHEISNIPERSKYSQERNCSPKHERKHFQERSCSPEGRKKHSNDQGCSPEYGRRHSPEQSHSSEQSEAKTSEIKLQASEDNQVLSVGRGKDQESETNVEHLKLKLKLESDQLTDDGGVKSVSEEPQLGRSSRWALRSKTLEVQEESPKLAGRSKRSKKSVDDETQQDERSDEKVAARRRTRSSRSTEELVDQKTPEVPIERQLSKRQKKSRRTSTAEEKVTHSIENDPKLSSPISVDLSSIALPGEGIRIKIFNEALSPKSKVTPSKKVTADSVTCNVKLEEIILPDEMPIIEKTKLAKEDSKKELYTSQSTAPQQEIAAAVMTEQSFPKDTHSSSQKTMTSEPVSKTKFSLRSRKLPEDRRQLIKFGLPKSGNANKLWDDDEEDVDFTDKLKKTSDDQIDTPIKTDIEMDQMKLEADKISSAECLSVKADDNISEEVFDVKMEDSIHVTHEKIGISSGKDNIVSSSDDDPEISFRSPTRIIKTKPLTQSIDVKEKIVETPVTSQQDQLLDRPQEKPMAMVETASSEAVESACTQVMTETENKTRKNKGRVKSRWNQPDENETESEVISLSEPTHKKTEPSIDLKAELYDPLLPTSDDLYDPTMPTDDEAQSSVTVGDDSTGGEVKKSEDVELYDPTRPTDLDDEEAVLNQPSRINVQENIETTKTDNIDEKPVSTIQEIELERIPRNNESDINDEKQPIVESEEKIASGGIQDTCDGVETEAVVSSLDETSETETDENAISDAEYIAKQIIKMSKNKPVTKAEHVSSIIKPVENAEEVVSIPLQSVEPETSGMIEITPDEIVIGEKSKTCLLTAKQLQLPTRENVSLKKSPIKDSAEEGEILSEADDKKEKEKILGMAIETVVSGKAKTKQIELVKVKVEPTVTENQGQIIQSIITSRVKPVIEHVTTVTKSVGKAEKPPVQSKLKTEESEEDKVKKAQTEEALKLLEQFKGIDTKNEEAIRMIEKFRSVDKELKTLDLDKPRSKKESWETESYKDRYEESKYRETAKYKEKDYDRYSKDRDYDRHKGYEKRREKLWDKRRREDLDRYESRDRDRHDRKRHKKDRYYDRGDRSYSRERSYSKSPSRGGRTRSRDRSHSRSRDRSSRERSRRRSRDRSRSRDRGRRSKRSRKEKRRYSSDESDDSRSSSRSSRREKDSYLDSSKGEVDKLTEEWIRMATEKPKKSKAVSSASSSTLPAMSSAAVTPQYTTASAYYQDAYGNYYPVTSTSQSYQSYPGTPTVQTSSQAMAQPSMLPNQGMPSNQTVPQGMPPPLHGHVMPPPVQGHGLPPVSYSQGMPTPLEGHGITQASYSQGMPPQLEGHGIPPVSLPQGMPPPGQMLPPQSIPSQNQYQQPSQQVYSQLPVYGQTTQDPLYDQSMFGQAPQVQQAQPQGGLLPTPTMSYGPMQDPAVQSAQYQPGPVISGQESAANVPRPPLIGEKPVGFQPEPAVKLPFTSNLQGTRLPFPMPTQQNVPVFKPAQPKVVAALQQKLPVVTSPQEMSPTPVSGLLPDPRLKPALPKQVSSLQPKILPVTSPQDISQSPSQLPDSRTNTASPIVVTSSKDYQLPELPYQEELAQLADSKTENSDYKPVEVKPLSKPLMAMKGFKIKQKGLSLVMPTENVVSSSFQSDTEDKVKKAAETSQTESESAEESPVTDLPKHPPPSSQTGLPIKLGMKQDKREVDLASPPPSASPRPEKVKSRWRRLSDFETPVNQSPDSNVIDGSGTPASEGESSPAKEPTAGTQTKPKESVVYDAWDPASDIVITPETLKAQPSFKAAKKDLVTTPKREKKEKQKEPESPLKTEKVKETESPLKVVKEPEEEKDPNKPPTFEQIDENVYLSENKKKSKKMKRMLCDCTITEEEKKCMVEACGEDCLNRMLYIECGNRCQCGEFCTNKRFQRRQYSDVEPFRTEWKGFGLKTNKDLPPGRFVMEYVGEVLDYKTFKARTKQYAKSGESHFYFMALNADEVIDASYRGNISRFINHSCDPNCETQKWTVNGCLRVGFFTKKLIPAGTELTFDYQFETYGKEAQKCFCGTDKCRGTIGINKSTPLKSTKKPAEEEKKRSEELFQDEDLEEELNLLLEQGLHNKNDVLNICRLMVRAEDMQDRIKILNIVQECSEGNCLRLFLDYHGLELLWTWMADNKEECQELKVKILNTLKILPITTKNMLKDSKILSLIQRWAGREEGEELLPCPVVPPPPVPKQIPISILASSKDNRPMKKRVRFPDEASSDDNESRASTSDNFSEYTSNELYTDFEGQSSSGNDRVSEAEAVEEHQSSDIDSTSDDSQGQEKPVRSPADSTGDVQTKVEVETVAADSSSALEEIKYIEPRPDPLDEVALLADELLVNWSDLKELFRIPKKQQVEERKRIEKELDNSVKSQRIEQLERDQDRFRHLAAGWDTRKKKKRPPPPPPPDEEELTDPSRPRKVLLPTPPKMSKEERRQIFEAQVKAQEEMAELERQQREAYLQQFYSDPNNYLYYGQDPNFPFQLQQGVEPGMEQYIDPNTGLPIPPEVLQAYIAQQQQGAQAGYTDEALQQQLLTQQVQEQLLAQQAMAGYVQPTQEMMYQPNEAPTGESQVFLQQTATTTPQKDSIAERVQQLQQQFEMQGQLSGMGTSEEEDVPPPPSPPKSKAPKLPPNWKSAKDAEGKVYYYHTTTRQTQWSPPTWDGMSQDDMDIDTPPEEIKSSKKKTTTAAADTSTETAKKIKDQFRQKMSSYIVLCLNPYRKPDCKMGRIVSTDDFKHLARKLTHHVMSKELKHCRHVEDLEVNENVKAKAKDYVKKYMSKFGTMYRKTSSPDD